MFEDDDNRDDNYLHFVMGCALMHERLTALIVEASQREDNMHDPAWLDWIEKDLRFAQRVGPQWSKMRDPLAAYPLHVEPPALPVRARNVLSDRRDDQTYAIFGEGWNPDRFAHLWRMFERDILPASVPFEVREHMRGTFLSGIGAAFWDIARAYTKAANAKNPEAFRRYLRDFRRSLERVTQPADANKMH
jgi:hypothetical protein